MRGLDFPRARRRDRHRCRPAVEIMDLRAVPAGGVQATFAVTQDWGSGFGGKITLSNSQSTAVANWKLEFDYTPTIDSIWDATIVSHTSTHYVLNGAGWNNTLPANGAVSFGFNAHPGHTTAAPTNYWLNGVALNGSNPPPVPSISIADAKVTEPSNGSTNIAFTVTLSQPSASAVTVHYATANGTAVAGTDYQAVSGTLTFNAGVTQQTIPVKVSANPQIKSDETFNLSLSSPVGASIARAQAVGTIVDSTPAPGGNIQFSVTNDWGSGFNGQITISNKATTALSAWNLAFDFPVTISSIWDANIVSHTTNHYVIKSKGWNDTIAAGGTASFGFTANPGGIKSGPTSYVLTGNSTSGGGGGTNSPPVAVNDSAYTYVGQATPIPVLANDSDPNNDALTVASVTQGQNGTVTINSDGTLTYTPKAGYVGSDSFKYTISDGHGGAATATVSVTVLPTSTATWPTQVFAPYVDMTLYPTYNLTTAAQAGRIKYFTLAFIVADAKNEPAWGGYSTYAVNGGAFDQQMRAQVAGVRSLGGDVMVSFGGAANQELAQTITSVSALQAAYQSVVDAYHLTHIDFDIEGAAVADHASIDRRSQAIAALQQADAAAGKPVQVWLTLPVLPTGLDNNGLYVLQSAVRYGVKVAGVDVMAMDYGEGAAPNPQGHMGDYAIQAATSLFGQLRTVYGSAPTDAQLWQMVGVTPMIGLNDDTNELFDRTDAQKLTTFAIQKGMGRISMWSLNRDQQNPSGKITYVESTSSSILQKPYDFSKIFMTFEN